MRLILMVVIMLVSFLSSCREKKRCENIFSFNEKEYQLVNTINDDFGKKYSEEFISIKEKDLHLKKFFWENGNLQSIVFFSNRKKFGPYRYFDSSENLLYEGFYYNDKETGVSIEYDPESKQAKIVIHKAGEELNQTELK
jgi:antitoxin component YwqK of YwqJK toxin-antitoxin module